MADIDLRQDESLPAGTKTRYRDMGDGTHAQVVAANVEQSSDFATLRVGDIAGGNYTQFEADGTMAAHGEATGWDDLEGALFAQRLTTPAGRVDYNFTDLTVDFQVNARYPEEVVGIVGQMRHRYEYGTVLEPHLHYVQNQDETPNWMIAYRIVQNGLAVGAWTNVRWTNLIFTYTAGSILQIVEFPSIAGVNTISFAVQIKLFRDSADASGLFGAGDPYAGTAQAMFFDTHFKNNTLGSRTEFVK